MHDLVIRNATVVDGTGRDRYVADVAIDGSQIVFIGHEAAVGRVEIDANGKLLTPGWVDIPTRYDGQVTWDPYLTPSSCHGVTTAVMGNCGVGFAPVRPGDEHRLIEIMEAVEDIPGTALVEGMTWSWETFPEYLDALDALPLAIDVGTQVPHASVRAYVMGVDGAYRVEASADEIAEMAALTTEALRAGALGFSTSRTIAHRDKHGKVIPGTRSLPEEMVALGRALGAAGHGVFEMAADSMGREPDLSWMQQICKETGRPITFALAQLDADPDAWRDVLHTVGELAAEGIVLRPQVCGRPTGVLMGFRTSMHPFMECPTFLAIKDLAAGEFLAQLKDAAIRQRILSEGTPSENRLTATFISDVAKLFPMSDAPDYDYEPTQAMSVSQMAADTGVDAHEIAYDAMLKNDGESYLFYPLGNYSRFNHDHVREMLLDERTLLGLSDGGAHCGLIADAGMPTFMLTHWARDRQRGERIPLERIVKLQTRDTAELYGLLDRGTIAVGMKADLNIIDFEALHLHPPKMIFDLPSGGRRIVQEVEGYIATIVSGKVIYENGQATGAMPGRLIRGPQMARR